MYLAMNKSLSLLSILPVFAVSVAVVYCGTLLLRQQQLVEQIQTRQTSLLPTDTVLFSDAIGREFARNWLVGGEGAIDQALDYFES